MRLTRWVANMQMRPGLGQARLEAVMCAHVVEI